jgi:hypothetical protein
VLWCSEQFAVYVDLERHPKRWARVVTAFSYCQTPPIQRGPSRSFSGIGRNTGRRTGIASPTPVPEPGDHVVDPIGLRGIHAARRLIKSTPPGMHPGQGTCIVGVVVVMLLPPSLLDEMRRRRLTKVSLFVEEIGRVSEFRPPLSKSWQSTSQRCLRLSSCALLRCCVSSFRSREISPSWERRSRISSRAREISVESP